jgi:hypothetical protein
VTIQRVDPKAALVKDIVYAVKVLVENVFLSGIDRAELTLL